MFEHRYRINAPDVVSEEFDGEVVILDLTNGVYCSFRGSGDRLWQALLAGVAPADLLAALASGGSPFEAEARAFIGELVSAGLLRRDEAPAAPAPVHFAISEPPRLERFDDLAELIMADPIHDSDAERGWPLQRIEPAIGS